MCFFVRSTSCKIPDSFSPLLQGTMKKIKTKESVAVAIMDLDDLNLRHDPSSSVVTTPLLIEQQDLNEKNETTREETTSRWRPAGRLLTLRSWLRRIILQPAGSSDSNLQQQRVIVGWTALVLMGTVLGMLLPKNPDLPSKWYRVVSSCMGYTYFLAWSISFYPQLIYNYRRKGTTGLSPDFCGLNVLGFGCYSVYNLSFYSSKAIQDMYRHRHDHHDDGDSSNITVQSNDVAFAVHALLVSSMTLAQIGYYNGIRKLRPSKVIGLVMLGILITCTGGALLLVVVPSASLWFDWLDYLYLLSFFKIMISLIKYIPQMLLNYRRKSTVGWSIWNIFLDFTGGVLSDLQLVFDCADMGDWSGITGNLAKLGLGFVSIFFDIIFMLQHYVLYPEETMQPVSPTPLLLQEEDQQQQEGTIQEHVPEDLP